MPRRLTVSGRDWLTAVCPQFGRYHFNILGSHVQWNSSLPRPLNKVPYTALSRSISLSLFSPATPQVKVTEFFGSVIEVELTKAPYEAVPVEK